jgi:hypothetical protein
MTESAPCERVEVTGDECTMVARVRVRVSPTKVVDGWACWYPQMGGYVGKCVVVAGTGGSSCFEAYVWHDGEFPFGADSFGPEDTRWPAHIHLCDEDQFRGFADVVAAAFKAEESGCTAPLYPERVPRMRVVPIRSHA